MNAFAGRLLAAACAAACWLTAPARAETVLAIPTASGSDVTIKLAMPAAQPPRFGFAPVRVTIENSASQERTWQVQFQSGVRGQFPGTVYFERSFTVPAGRTSDTWVYVPVAEPGTPGGAPSLSSGGIAAGAGVNPSSPTSVTITKTLTGTRVVRTMASAGTGAVFMTEETNIDAATGELTAIMKTPTGGTTNTRSTKPPAGTDVTYTIDPNTGYVSSRFSSTKSMPGSPRVTILTGPASATSSTTTPTRVTITPTPVGTKVTRVMTISGSKLGTSITTEREIDAQTGVITTTTISSSGSSSPGTSTLPLNPGTETTFTINPTTGSIGTTTRIASNPAALPKVTIVTGPASGSSTFSTVGTASRSSTGSTFSPRIVSSPYQGPAMVLSAEVTGPGVSAGNRVNFASLGASANMRPMAATLALERVLREGLNNEGLRTPNLAAIDPAQLPADWRVWSAFACVFLTVDEYATLDAARRAALRGWVAFGGQLYLTPSDAGKRASESLGAGAIITLAAPLKTAPTSAEMLAAGISLGGTPGHPDADSLTMRAATPLGEAVAEKEAGTTWLTIFLVLFAVIIGPVNLFVFAPATKRHRLFLTTPAISLVAAVILGLTILGQDGTGGDGLRRALVVLVPGDNQAAIFQEQSATTGFLASQAFALPSDTQLTALPLDENLFARVGSFNAPSLVRDEARASGEWFRSRGRQAHLLQRLVPTRARVERVGTGPEGAPIVQSSLAGALRDFVCVDDKGDLWTARELTPGRRVTLERGIRWINSIQLGGTKRFAQVFAAATPKDAGRWGAKGDEGELGPLATIGSVRWSKIDVVYTGMLEGVAVEAGEAKR